MRERTINTPVQILNPVLSLSCNGISVTQPVHKMHFCIFPIRKRHHNLLLSLLILTTKLLSLTLGISSFIFFYENSCVFITNKFLEQRQIWHYNTDTNEAMNIDNILILISMSKGHNSIFLTFISIQFNIIQQLDKVFNEKLRSKAECFLSIHFHHTMFFCIRTTNTHILLIQVQHHST